MAGTNAGTGQPLFFRCAAERRELDWRTGLSFQRHDVVRTGRERPYRGGHHAGIRTDTVAREYCCSCGHVGWSAHRELASSRYAPVGWI